MQPKLKFVSLYCLSLFDLGPVLSLFVSEFSVSIEIIFEINSQVKVPVLRVTTWEYTEPSRR